MNLSLSAKYQLLSAEAKFKHLSMASCEFTAPICRPRSPDVRAVGGQVCIKLQVHEGADFRWLLSQLMVLLGDQGSSSAAVQDGKAELQVHPFILSMTEAV